MSKKTANSKIQVNLEIFSYHKDGQVITSGTVLELAHAASAAHTTIAVAKDDYSKAGSSLSQVMIRFAQIAGTLEMFNAVAKELYSRYETQYREKVPQAMYDAVSICRGIFKHGIPWDKATSVEQVKKLVKDARGNTKSPFHAVTEELRKVWTGLDEQNQARMLDEMGVLGRRFAEVLATVLPEEPKAAKKGKAA